MIKIHKRFFVFTLTLILILNFIFIPEQKVFSIGPALGAIYGVELGTKILAFLYACLALGVTFNALDEAQALFDKWQMDSGNWEPPPDGGGGNGWKDTIQAILAGAVGSNIIQNLIANLKDFFHEIGAKEGENEYLGSSFFYDEIEKIQLWDEPKEFSVPFSISYFCQGYFVEMTVTDGEFQCDCIVSVNGQTNSTSKQIAYYLHKNKDEPIIRLLGPSLSGNEHGRYIGFKYQYYSGGSIVTTDLCTMYKGKYTIPPIENPPVINPEPEFEYNVRENAPVITDEPIIVLPQPSIEMIPKKEVVLPSGESKIYLDGEMDEAIDSIVNTITFDDIQTGTDSYTMTETETGTEIQVGQSTPIPYPDPFDTEIPESELEGQQTIIGLIKSVINWISQIPRLIGNLFVPTKKLDFSPLQAVSVTEKWPFSIPSDVLQVFENLKFEGKAPVYELPLPDYGPMGSIGLFGDDEIVIDFATFDAIAQLVRVLLTILFFIAICVLTWKVFI